MGYPLVGGIPTPLKNISQLGLYMGLLFRIYGKHRGKIKMFQTTNQYRFTIKINRWSWIRLFGPFGWFISVYKIL